jgi:sulfite reductase (ferredoxin)
MPDGSPPARLSHAEHVKAESRALRGSIAAELADSSAVQVSEAAYTLLKFHGTYEQYNRDTATELKQAGQEKDWQFMVRARVPAGRLNAAQYLALDDLAGRHGNGSLRITTRQTFQFHAIAKDNLRAAIADVEATLLTTFATCGDVVRNVTATPAPVRDRLHAELEAAAHMLSSELLPRSRSHHAIFIDGADDGAGGEDEPLYGPTYLPRKFKIGIAHQSDNTVDVLTNDLGLVAEADDAGHITHYTLCVGGGLGMTHNKPRTYPRLATPVARVPATNLLRGVRAVVMLARDFADRADRKRARLKYVVDDMGLPWVKARLDEYFDAVMEPPAPLPRFAMPDHLGWHAQGDGRFWLGIPVPSGRIQGGLRAALREVVAQFSAAPTLTPDQDILLADLDDMDRAAIEGVIRRHGVRLASDITPLARRSLACPALPTCGLALSEAERIHPALLDSVHAAMARHGLADEPIVLRITGCPNGCARPYAAEIGIVGRQPDHFAIYLGGAADGTRLAVKTHEKVPEAQIAAALEPYFAAFAKGRALGENFGDWCARAAATVAAAA